MSSPVLTTFGPGNIDELLTTTLQNMRPGIKDNVFKSNSLFKWLYGKNKIKTRGGASISHGVMYGTNTTASSYQRYDTLNVTPQDGLTRDQWPWAQYAVSVTIDGFTERVANAGAQKLEDLMDEKKDQAEKSLQLVFEQHFFQASPGAKDMQSLPAVVANSGSIGDINGTSNTWWQSQVVTSGSFASQGRADMTNLWNTISVQNPSGGPEIIVSSQSEYQFYETSLVGSERFLSNKNVDIGIETMTFKGTPWIWSPQAASGTIYMLHTDALEFFVNSETDFLTTPFVKPANQDARTAQVLVACQLTTGNRRKLGKMTSVTA